MAHWPSGTRIFTTALSPIILVLVIVCSLQSGIASGLSDSPAGPMMPSISTDEAHAKNVILLIGDGMGHGQVDAARWERSGHNLTAYRSPLLAMDRLAYAGNVSTASASAPITDSAAAITALLTGVRTNNGVIGQDATAVCGVSDGAWLETIAELAGAGGRATGAVSNMRLTHATPAGVYAHVNSRDNELLIARQFLDSGLDVGLSGGYCYFINQTATDPWGAPGLRTDGQDLVAAAQAKGYTVVTTAPLLDAVPAAPGTKMLGLFAPSEMRYESERPGSQQPSVAEMAEKAISVLSADDDGFFLMVEGGMIDAASGNNDYAAMTSETLAFDDAVRTALAFADRHPDTLLIVTADHETGGVTRGENSDGTPSFFFTATDHTAADVPIMASGPGADRIGTGTIRNTQVFELMRDAMDLVPVTPTPTHRVAAVPPETALPTDGNGDGVCEDVNGNGRKDFADVVLFFNQMSWIAASEPVAAFDDNANGRIDFADVVWLFNHL